MQLVEGDVYLTQKSAVHIALLNIVVYSDVLLHGHHVGTGRKYKVLLVRELDGILIGYVLQVDRNGCCSSIEYFL